jgi:hypothetical protein
MIMNSKGYNGHKNRAHWNVSLWIGNDERLYNMAREQIHMGKHRGLTRAEIASNILDQFSQAGIASTPDGYRYNVTNIRAAIVGM